MGVKDNSDALSKPGCSGGSGLVAHELRELDGLRATRTTLYDGSRADLNVSNEPLLGAGLMPRT